MHQTNFWKVGTVSTPTSNSPLRKIQPVFSIQQLLLKEKNLPQVPKETRQTTSSLEVSLPEEMEKEHHHGTLHRAKKIAS